MRRFLITLLILGTCLSAGAQDKLLPQRYIEDKAKPTLVMFSAEWCHPCQYMKNKVLKRSAVKKALEDFNVLIFDVDQEEGKSLAETFRPAGFTGGIPYFILLDKDRNVISTMAGSHSKTQHFLDFLGQIASTESE